MVEKRAQRQREEWSLRQRSNEHIRRRDFRLFSRISFTRNRDSIINDCINLKINWNDKTSIFRDIIEINREIRKIKEIKI